MTAAPTTDALTTDALTTDALTTDALTNPACGLRDRFAARRPSPGAALSRRAPESDPCRGNAGAAARRSGPRTPRAMTGHPAGDRAREVRDRFAARRLSPGAAPSRRAPESEPRRETRARRRGTAAPGRPAP